MESTIEAIHLEVAGYIQKPLSMQVVLDSLHQAIEKRTRVRMDIRLRLETMLAHPGKDIPPVCLKQPATEEPSRRRPCLFTRSTTR